MTDKAKPELLECERMVIGAVLYDDALLKKLPYLSPDQFSDPLHQEVVRLIVDRKAADRAISLPAIARKMSGSSLFSAYGGIEYLAALVERAPEPDAAMDAYEALDWRTDDGFQIDPEWWEAIITAGACWRAAKAQPSKREYWEGQAREWSATAGALRSAKGGRKQ